MFCNPCGGKVKPLLSTQFYFSFTDVPTLTTGLSNFYE